MKTQDIRLLDVPLGLFMVWFGLRAPADRVSKLVMILAGIGTIVYNLSNYLDKEAELTALGVERCRE